MIHEYDGRKASEHFETFDQLADKELDPKLASDLRFTARIAGDISTGGGLALVVGGFARDMVLSRIHGQTQISKDIDVEVYGVEFERLAEGLESYGKADLVGASFGIAKVRNPETGNVLDFSIPREDSKVDKGHRGFAISGNPNMTVREAARRRDLTINALALNPLTGELIDEYGGVDDLRAGVLRATDPSLFGDDPLRALRVMQFAGRFGFTVEPGTVTICQNLDLHELAAERIGEEWIKLLTKSEKPSVGMEVARQLGILKQLHPDLAILESIPQELEWHPEGNVWNHTKNATDAAAQVVRDEGLVGNDALVVLFGALCHDLGKATTTEQRVKHGVMRITADGHEAAGVEPTKRFLKQLNLSNAIIESVVPIVREHLYHVHNPNPTNEHLRRFARRLVPANIRLWDLVSRCDSNGRGDVFQPVTPSHALYRKSLELAVDEKPAEPIVRGQDLIDNLGLKPGRHFGDILRFLYEAQLGDQFTTVEDGIDYLKSHYS